MQVVNPQSKTLRLSVYSKIVIKNIHRINVLFSSSVDFPISAVTCKMAAKSNRWDEEGQSDKMRKSTFIISSHSYIELRGLIEYGRRINP
jgi:hypothetical protein